MCCLNCKKENLRYSESLTEEERIGVLANTERFALCNNCGCVMIENNGELADTDDIRDMSIISLAYLKLFNNDSAQPPTHYGFTKDSEKMTINNGFKSSAVPQQEEVTYQQEKTEETYPHVDKPEPISMLGKIRKFFNKIFNKAS